MRARLFQALMIISLLGAAGTAVVPAQGVPDQGTVKPQMMTNNADPDWEVVAVKPSDPNDRGDHGGVHGPHVTLEESDSGESDIVWIQRAEEPDCRCAGVGADRTLGCGWHGRCERRTRCKAVAGEDGKYVHVQVQGECRSICTTCYQTAATAKDAHEPEGIESTYKCVTEENSLYGRILRFHPRQ